MEIKINEKTLAAVLNETAEIALKEKMQSWEIKNAIGAVISNEVMGGVISEAIKKARERIDHERLVLTLAKEIERSAISATVHILEEGFVSTVMKLRGYSEYGENRKDRAQVKAELFRKRDRL